MNEEKKAYPLCWPAGWKRTINVKTSQFGAYNRRPKIASAIFQLLNELRKMHATDVIVSTNVKVKADNLPYSEEKQPHDTGVAVYFTLKKQPTVIACDSFDRVGCNLWAIGKTIEALRGIDRWGCSELMQKAFTGFLALPEKASEAAWHQVFDLPINATLDQAKTRFWELCKIHHPDVGGDSEQWHIISRAWEEAQKHFNQK